jgi:hypothetical protein
MICTFSLPPSFISSLVPDSRLIQSRAPNFQGRQKFCPSSLSRSAHHVRAPPLASARFPSVRQITSDHLKTQATSRTSTQSIASQPCSSNALFTRPVARPPAQLSSAPSPALSPDVSFLPFAVPGGSCCCRGRGLRREGGGWALAGQGSDGKTG